MNMKSSEALVEAILASEDDTNAAPQGGSDSAGRNGAMHAATRSARTGGPRPGNSGGIPKLALTKKEAAAALSVSVDFFDEHIAHELPMIRRGRRRLVPVRALQRWVDMQADLAGA
jgi:excisionase family DNA binding protein